MSFLKLCQLSNEQYIETADQEIVLNNIQPSPFTISCEIIDWESEEDFKRRGKSISFEAVEVDLSGLDQSVTVRDKVYEILIGRYPNLIK